MLRVRAASRKLYFIIHPRISYLSSRYMINDCHTKRRRQSSYLRSRAYPRARLQVER